MTGSLDQSHISKAVKGGKTVALCISRERDDDIWWEYTSLRPVVVGSSKCKQQYKCNNVLGHHLFYLVIILNDALGM